MVGLSSKNYVVPCNLMEKHLIKMQLLFSNAVFTEMRAESHVNASKIIQEDVHNQVRLYFISIEYINMEFYLMTTCCINL